MEWDVGARDDIAVAPGDFWGGALRVLHPTPPATLPGLDPRPENGDNSWLCYAGTGLPRRACLTNPEGASDGSSL